MLDIGYESDSENKSLTYVVVDLVQLGKEPQLGGVIPRTYGGGEGESARVGRTTEHVDVLDDFLGTYRQSGLATRAEPNFRVEAIRFRRICEVVDGEDTDPRRGHEVEQTVGGRGADDVIVFVQAFVAQVDLVARGQPGAGYEVVASVEEPREEALVVLVDHEIDIIAACRQQVLHGDRDLVEPLVKRPNVDWTPQGVDGLLPTATVTVRPMTTATRVSVAAIQPVAERSQRHPAQPRPVSQLNCKSASVESVDMLL